MTKRNPDKREQKRLKKIEDERLGIPNHSGQHKVRPPFQKIDDIQMGDAVTRHIQSVQRKNEFG